MEVGGEERQVFIEQQSLLPAWLQAEQRVEILVSKQISQKYTKQHLSEDNISFLSYLRCIYIHIEQKRRVYMTISSTRVADNDIMRMLECQCETIFRMANLTT